MIYVSEQLSFIYWDYYYLEVTLLAIFFDSAQIIDCVFAFQIGEIVLMTEQGFTETLLTELGSSMLLKIDTPSVVRNFLARAYKLIILKTVNGLRSINNIVTIFLAKMIWLCQIIFARKITENRKMIF